MDWKPVKAKIVCTLGPATSTREAIRALIDEGMDVARLNLSHGSHEEHRRNIRNVRAVAEEAGRHIAILFDLSGPKIRTGPIAAGSVTLTPGAEFILTARDVAGDASEVSISYKGLVQECTPGDTLLLADGALELRVVGVTDTDIRCEVVVGGELGAHKGINVPEKPLRLPSMTEKDRLDLAFGMEEQVDWVALSFVRTREDLRAVKEAMRPYARPAPVLAKIEKRAALDHLDDILAEADGVMVARGDLGVEIPMYEVPWVQKEIIRKANAVGIPVVTATQMLESMIQSPRPTRAELTDVANAVLDGTDAIMLSGETAIGRYPVAAVRIMKEIADSAATHLRYAEMMMQRHLISSGAIKDAISQAACELATVLRVDFLICCTRSGQTAHSVARFRPPVPIIGVSSDARVLRQLQLYWGVHPVLIPEPSDTDDILRKSKQALLAMGKGKAGDRVVIVAGIPLDAHGTTNMIKADVL